MLLTFALRLCGNFSRFGLPKAPLTLAIACTLGCGTIWAQGQPASMHLSSEAPSIHIVFNGQDSNGLYRLLLQNSSPRVVTDTCVGTAPDSSNVVYYVRIPPGGSFILRTKGEDGLLLQAVLYDDGTYEGDPKQASMLAAMRVGRSLMWEQLKPRIDEIVVSGGSDESLLEQIRTEVAALPDAPGPTAMVRLKTSFPKVPLVEAADFSWLTSGYRGMKDACVSAVNGFENRLTQDPRSQGPIAQWWPRLKQEYDSSTSTGN